MLARADARVPALDAAAGLGRAGPRGLVARGRGGARGGRRPDARSPGSASPGQMHGLVALDAADQRDPARRSSGTTSARRPSARRSRSGSALERLIALTGNRALTGFTAPKLLWLRRHEPDAYARIARVMLPKDYVRLRLTGEWAIDAADASGTLLLRRRAAPLERRGARRARAARATGCRPSSSRPSVAGRTTACDTVSQGDARRGRGRRPAGGGARGRDRPAGAGLRRARHVRRRPRRAARVRARPRGRASTPSATRCPTPGRRWA